MSRCRVWHLDTDELGPSLDGVEGCRGVSSWSSWHGVSRCRVGVEVWCRGVEARAQVKPRGSELRLLPNHFYLHRENRDVGELRRPGAEARRARTRQERVERPVAEFFRFGSACTSRSDPAPAHAREHAREAGRETPHRQGCSQQAHRTPPACAESLDIARTFAPRAATLAAH